MLGINPSLSLHTIMKANCSGEEINKVIGFVGLPMGHWGLKSSKDLIMGVGSLCKFF